MSAATRHRRSGAALLLTVAALGGVGACRTSGTIEAPVPADAEILGPDLKPVARLGKLPVTVDAVGDIARYALQPTGAASEYLMVLAPGKVNGAISVPLQKTGEHSQSAVTYHDYLDVLLRAHRQIMRGEVDDARAAVDRLDEKYEVTYGSLVLRGDIAYLQGDGPAAARYFELARRVLPGAMPLKGVAP